MAKKSKHAALLREMGFEPYSEEAEAYMADRSARRLAQAGINLEEELQKLSRNDRRAFKKFTSTPTFGFMPGPEKTVIVKDEIGRSWSTRKEVDVSVLKNRGFKDVTVEMELTAAAKLPPPPPRKNN